MPCNHAPPTASVKTAHPGRLPTLVHPFDKSRCCDTKPDAAEGSELPCHSHLHGACIDHSPRTEYFSSLSSPHSPLSSGWPASDSNLGGVTISAPAPSRDLESSHSTCSEPTPELKSCPCHYSCGEMIRGPTKDSPRRHHVSRGQNWLTCFASRSMSLHTPFTPLHSPHIRWTLRPAAAFNRFQAVALLVLHSRFSCWSTTSARS